MCCIDNLILDSILAQTKEKFDCYISDQVDLFHWEMEFSSANPFPIEIFEQITAPYLTSSLYIQIISYELPDEYLAHHVFKNGIWTDKMKKGI